MAILNDVIGLIKHVLTRPAVKFWNTLSWAHKQFAPGVHTSFYICGIIGSQRSFFLHYIDVIMRVMAFQITDDTIVYSTVCLGEDQRKHQSSVSLTLWGNSPVTVEFPTQRASNTEMFPCEDVIMNFSVTIIPGNGLAPLIARPSSGTVVAMCR